MPVDPMVMALRSALDETLVIVNELAQRIHDVEVAQSRLKDELATTLAPLENKVASPSRLPSDNGNSRLLNGREIGRLNHRSDRRPSGSDPNQHWHLEVAAS